MGWSNGTTPTSLNQIADDINSFLVKFSSIHPETKTLKLTLVAEDMGAKAAL